MKLPYQIEQMIEQLGGPIIFRMAFAGSAYETPDALDRGKYSLTLKVDGSLSRSRGVPTHVKVTLEPSDTYTVETYKIRGAKSTLLDARADVYCDTLQDTVEKMTGLALSLGRSR